MPPMEARTACAGLLHARPNETAEVGEARVRLAGRAGRPEALKQLPHARQHPAQHPLRMKRGEC